MNNEKVNREFRLFGDKMYLILIFYLLNFIIPVIPGIIMLIFTIKSLGNIKRANQELKSDDLDDFRNYFIWSYVLISLTASIIIIAAILFVIAFWPYIITQTIPTPADLPMILISLIIPGILLVIGLIMLLVAMILRYSAWGNLTEFFIKNSGIFPEAIAHDARRGAENLKTASLCMILFFFIITIPISLIYEILGYIKLSKLKNLMYSGVLQSSQSKEKPSSTTEQKGEFCPYCGAKNSEGAIFCSSCGQHF